MAKAPKLPPYSADEIAADPDLAAALVRDAEPLLAIERQIKALREQKADLFDDLRCSRFKPEYAKAWVATQMPDEEKDAARAEKAIELARVVAAMDGVKASQARARAGVRPREAMPAPRQEEIDPETGEVLGDAPAPVPMTAEEAAAHLARITGATEVMVNGRSAYPAPLRTLPPRVPEPAPEMPDLPAFLDRRNERVGQEAAE